MPILHLSPPCGLQGTQERGNWVSPAGSDASHRPCLLLALRPDRLQGLPLHCPHSRALHQQHLGARRGADAGITPLAQGSVDAWLMGYI